jgi:hypothetical protein
VDRVRLIIRHEWRAYWRRFSRAGFRSNQGIILLFSLLVAFKYFQVLRVAAANVANGHTRLLLQLLTAIFLVWVFPVAANRRDTLASRKWMHLPLLVGERFMVRAISLLIPPSAWLALFGSLAILFPLAHAQNTAAGIVAGLLFIVTAWFTGLTIAHLLNSPSWRKLLWIAAIAILIAGGVYVIKGGRAVDLLSFQFVPSRLVVDAAMESQHSATFASLGILLALAIAAASGAIWSFKSSLVSVSETGGRKIFRSSLVLPGRLGGLIVKDFSYFRRLLDIYLGLAAATLACLYLLVASEASAGVFWSFIVIVFLCNAALPFNSFGLDNRAGLDRYALLPLSGRSVLLSKNVAYLMIVGAQLLPVFVLAGWRLGPLTSAFGLFEAFALACSYLAWGNWMSVNHPLKMQFFRFANSGAALVDAMGGIFFGSLPGILMIFLMFRGGRGSTAGVLLLLLLTSALYFASLVRFGYRFERTREHVAEALS